MWSQFAADARVYCALHWPGKAGIRWRALVWVRSPGLLVLALQRVNHRYLSRRARCGWSAGTLMLRLLVALSRRPIAILTKCDVADGVDIGQGVYLSDRGFLILGAERIGDGAVVHERVTIGVRAGDSRRPVIGASVWIGPDCVIYGHVSLGDGATVLPGSVVSMNVPAGAVAAGNPAIVVRRQFDNAALRCTLVTEVDGRTLVSA